MAENSVAYDAAHMVATLPIDRATLFYADVGALRKAGILDLLAGSKAAEEPDYRKFVAQTGFDYRKDLDAVAAAFAANASYFTVRGHFQWKQLAAYAKSQGGECRYAICWHAGKHLGTQYFVLSATARCAGARRVVRYQRRHHDFAEPGLKAAGSRSRTGLDLAPASVLTKPGALPENVHALLSPLAHAEKVTLAAGPQGARAQLRLDRSYASPRRTPRQWSASSLRPPKLLRSDDLAGPFDVQSARLGRDCWWRHVLPERS